MWSSCNFSRYWSSTSRKYPSSFSSFFFFMKSSLNWEVSFIHSKLFSGKFSRSSLWAFKPAWWGTLGYKPTTSAVTRMAFLGTLPIVFIFSKKWWVSYVRCPFCIIGLRWWSKSSETFSVGVPQLEITGLPRTLKRPLWIFGSRYNLPKLHAFLYSYVKYFISL